MQCGNSLLKKINLDEAKVVNDSRVEPHVLYGVKDLDSSPIK